MPAESRQAIDPGHQFPAAGMRHCEANALRMLDLCPDARLAGRSRDCLELALPTGAEPGDALTILVTAENIELRLPTMEWPLPHEPAAASRLARRVPVSAPDSQLRSAMENLRQRRLREFVSCRFCGQRVPPEHRHSKTVCHGCAEKHLGIVH